jgi:drug/metabolite transporter (DMT)-like permease
MNIGTVLAAVCIAFGFASWPIIGSYSRASGAWVGTMACIASLIAVGLLSLKQLAGVAAPSSRAILLLFIGGALNGIAVYYYAAKVADTAVPTAVFVVTVATLMAVAAPTLDWVIKGVVPNFRQLLGFCFAIVAIYFLSR